MTRLSTYLLAALLLMGCSEARKMERKRLKAEALIKEAIETYPDIIKPVVTIDTVTMWTDPEVITIKEGYSQASMDSLVRICADLLNAEREKQPGPVRRLQTQLCNIDTVKRSEGALDVMAWAKDGFLHILTMKHPERLDTAVTVSQRTITAEPCPPVEGRVRGGFWGYAGVALIFLIIGFLLGLFVRGSNRYAP